MRRQETLDSGLGDSPEPVFGLSPIARTVPRAALERGRAVGRGLLRRSHERIDFGCPRVRRHRRSLVVLSAPCGGRPGAPPLLRVSRGRRRKRAPERFRPPGGRALLPLVSLALRAGDVPAGEAAPRPAAAPR